MTHTDFNELLQQRQEKITEILSKKGNEYSNDDQLHNFKRAAEMSGISTKQALWGMLVKHLVSVKDYIDGKAMNLETIDEKIGDCINYFILLEAIIKETP